MTENLLLGLTSIVVLGILSVWLAWRLNLPSILLLIVVGFIAGPITGFVNPDSLLDEMLFPIVSASVAIILFEGGLSLRVRDLREVGKAVRNLVSIGVVVTWVLATLAAYLIFDFEPALAILFGAILVVTGPTVIVPLLRHLRPAARIGSVVKWEGIVNDPIGAILAVLTFETILAGGFREATLVPMVGLLETVLIGSVIGLLGAGLIVLLLKRFWVPGYLQNGITLAVVLGVFTASDMLHPESGLLTVTVMGIALANQKFVTVRHIVEFKENLRVLLISGLFIILTARLQLAQLAELSLSSLLFLAVLILIVRPVSVFVATFNSELTWREKLFLSWMAPRGIVAAAVTSLFALELAEEAGYAQAELMVPEMFLIIFGTVAIYGLTASKVGCWLGVAQPNPQGLLIVGAHKWARTIGLALKNEGYQVLMIDNNRTNIKEARLAGLRTFYASILSEYVLDEVELGGLGRLMAITPNDEVNSLAALHFIDVFDRNHVFQIPPKKTEEGRKEAVSRPLRGRLLFSPEATFTYLSEWFEAGGKIRKTQLTKKFDYQAFKDMYGSNALPLFLIDETGTLDVFTADLELAPQPGQSIISLVMPQAERKEEEVTEMAVAMP